MYDIFFIHSPAGGHLDYFQFMDITNNAYQFVLILVTQPTRIFTTEPYGWKKPKTVQILK